MFTIYDSFKPNNKITSKDNDERKIHHLVDRYNLKSKKENP